MHRVRRLLEAVHFRLANADAAAQAAAEVAAKLEAAKRRDESAKTAPSGLRVSLRPRAATRQPE
eukprot:5323424-Pleurochrysis_carterae.AAC.1